MSDCNDEKCIGCEHKPKCDRVGEISFKVATELHEYFHKKVCSYIDVAIGSKDTVEIEGVTCGIAMSACSNLDSIIKNGIKSKCNSALDIAAQSIRHNQKLLTAYVESSNATVH